MSRRLLGVIAAGGLAVAGCGSTASHFAERNRPPTPVDLTVYVNDARVSVSPASVGAGPVMFYVTNQASRTESLQIGPGGSAQPLASTGPINPGSTAQVMVDFNPGDYTVSASLAQTSAPPGTRGIAPATLRVGKPRPSADSALLQP